MFERGQNGGISQAGGPESRRPTPPAAPLAVGPAPPPAPAHRPPRRAAASAVTPPHRSPGPRSKERWTIPLPAGLARSFG